MQRAVTPVRRAGIIGLSEHLPPGRSYGGVQVEPAPGNGGLTFGTPVKQVGRAPAMDLSGADSWKREHEATQAHILR